MCCEGRFCPIIVFHFKKEGDPEQAFGFEGGWHGGKVVLELRPALAPSLTWTPSTTYIIRLLDIQPAPPYGCTHAMSTSTGKHRSSMETRHQPGPPWDPETRSTSRTDSPSRTGGTLLREAWAPLGRDFASTLPRHGPPVTLDFGSHAFERPCKVLTSPCHPSTSFHDPVEM